MCKFTSKHVDREIIYDVRQIKWKKWVAYDMYIYMYAHIYVYATDEVNYST